ncbi:MAG: transcription antitermination factor NusB [Tepidanaerobacteraceae bacterium]
MPFLSRKIAREQAFKILFAIDVGDNSVEEAADIVIPFLKDENQKSFILKEVYGVIENLSQIDKLIEKYSNEWSIERMAATDRNILRISVYEMIFCKEIPVSVSINEAVEISKKYCEEMSYKFINGLLGSIAKDYSLSSKNP